MQFPSWLKVLVVVLAVLIVSYPVIIDFFVDLTWFGALGYERAFLVTFETRAALFAAGFTLAALFIHLNVRSAIRAAPINYVRLAMQTGELALDGRQMERAATVIRWLATLLPALLFGLLASSRWLDVLSYTRRVDFGSSDPIFGHDIGFYFFELPVLALVRSYLSSLVFFTLIPVALVYFGREMFLAHTRPVLSRWARIHLAGLGTALFVLVAAGYWLDRFNLLFRQRGAVYGPGYADVEAQLPALWVMAALALVVASSLLVAAFRRGLRGPAFAIGGYFLAVVLVNGALPGLVQDYVVRPNELELERPYLEHNIRMTREAYALDRIEVLPFEAESGLSMTSIANNPLTVNNVRLWDARPLQSTYSQLQEIRLYYDFIDVDVDRYTIDGQPRQVMLSARELNYDNVPEQARSWVNEHFQYTHGYGLTMSPVNVVTPEGLPDLFIKDLPPSSKVGIEVERPEIYYGELTDRYVFLKTGAEEFDYPKGNQNVYTTYQGKGGVPIGTFGRKLLYALHFGSIDILLSDYLQSESRVMLRRRVTERASTIAPFLQYDRDPYLVVAEGKLYWMLDAYTVSERYPYSEPYRHKNGSNRYNYVRNAVKVVVDAYDGTVDFYVADEADPLVRVYQAIYPEVFRPLDDMPASLQAHIRYPVDFFNIQAEMYRPYHMLDTTVFYNREDMWEVPQELYGGQPQPMQSYYLIMKLPDQESAEFILLLPFTPTNRDNMISWLAARSDPPEYGKLILYQFPKQKLIFGPRQIEARIDQDPEISELITLWSQAGSRVVRGNLLVIPIDRSLMYVEPLYLQAESSQLPELKRVIVAYENKLAMRPTLDAALRAVFAASAPPPEEGTVAEADEPARPIRANRYGADHTWQQFAQKANEAFEAAVTAQKAGDWATYGDRLADLEAALQALKAAGAPPEAPAPE